MKHQFELPEFLLAEFPIKTGNSFNDERHFIVHKGITLIEVIPIDLYKEIHLNDGIISKRYKYNNENFILAYHTNNAHLYDYNQYELLDLAWEWYRQYLKWEDDNIDMQEKLIDN